MLKLKHIPLLSAIVDKMELRISNPKASQEEIGADLMLQLPAKLHKAEPELYAFVAAVKGVSVEEAKETDVIEFFRDLIGPETLSFFKSAVRSAVLDSSKSSPRHTT